MYYLKSIITFTLIYMLSGCSAESGRVFTFNDNIYNFESSALNKKLPAKTFYFKEGSVDNDVIHKNVTISIKKYITQYFKRQGLPDPVVNRDGFNKTLNFISDRNNNTSAPVVKSYISVKPQRKGINVSYIGGEYYGKRKAEAIQTTIFPIELDSRNGNVYFTVSYPSVYQHRKGNMGSGPAINPIFSHKEVNHAFEQAFNAVKVDNLHYTKTNTVEGEFTSKYPDDSIYANFQRRSTTGTNKKSIKKVSYLRMKIKNFDSVIKVAVYPYRGGSKVVYNADIIGDFTLTPKGGSNYKKLPGKQRVEKLLIAIANE